jgi:hypothetical protein
MVDVQALLRRQAEWQRSRNALSWPEKIRMVAVIRDSIVAIRATSLSEKSTKARVAMAPDGKEAE